MRTSLLTIAVAAAALAAGSAQARVSLKLVDLSVPASAVFCDSTATITATNCGTGFSFNSFGDIVFSGTVGGFTVNTTSFSSNTPGTAAAATLDASTTKVTRVAAGQGSFQIDLVGFNYNAPAGALKTLRGSASLTSSDSSFAAGDAVLSEFFTDGANMGGTFNKIDCSLALSFSANCNVGAVTWTDSDLGMFSMRDIQTITLSQGKVVNTTLAGTVNAVPEPMTLSLVGAALLAAGVASRRRANKA